MTKKKTLHPCRSIALKFFASEETWMNVTSAVKSVRVYTTPLYNSFFVKRKNMYILYMNMFLVDKTSSEGIAPEAFYILYTRCMPKRVKHAQPCP